MVRLIYSLILGLHFSTCYLFFILGLHLYILMFKFNSLCVSVVSSLFILFIVNWESMDQRILQIQFIILKIQLIYVRHVQMDGIKMFVHRKIAAKVAQMDRYQMKNIPPVPNQPI